MPPAHVPPAHVPAEPGPPQEYSAPFQPEQPVFELPPAARQRGRTQSGFRLVGTIALSISVGLGSGVVLSRAVPDLTASGNQIAGQGTLAYYSHRTKRIDVRGTDLTVGLRSRSSTNSPTPCRTSTST